MKGEDDNEDHDDDLALAFLILPNGFCSTVPFRFELQKYAAFHFLSEIMLLVVITNSNGQHKA